MPRQKISKNHLETLDKNFDFLEQILTGNRLGYITAILKESQWLYGNTLKNQFKAIDQRGAGEHGILWAVPFEHNIKNLIFFQLSSSIKVLYYKSNDVS